MNEPMERLVRSLKDDLDEARAALARRAEFTVTGWAYEQACRVMHEAKANLAERDAIIAAARPVLEAARALLEHYPDTEQPIPGGSMWLDDLASTLTELDHSAALSAPVEAVVPAAALPDPWEYQRMDVGPDESYPGAHQDLGGQD